MKKSSTKQPVTVFDKNKFNELNEFLSQKLVNFSELTDPNQACNEIISVYTEGIQKFSKTFTPSRRKTPQKPWITPGLLSCINRKNKL